jgi:integrase
MIITVPTVALVLADGCYCFGGFAATQTWTHQTYNLAGAAGVMHFVIDLSRDGFLFPNIRKGVISDSALSKHMRDKNLAGVPHGFRSILRTWLMDNNDISFEVTKMIVAHRTSSKVARAYTRTDYPDQRSHYMEK